MPVLLILVITVALVFRSWPIISEYGLSDLLFGEVWKPNDGQFGFWPFILGTLWVTIVGVILAVPPCLLASIYLAEYAHAKTRSLPNPCWICWPRFRLLSTAYGDYWPSSRLWITCLRLSPTVGWVLFRFLQSTNRQGLASLPQASCWQS